MLLQELVLENAGKPKYDANQPWGVLDNNKVAEIAAGDVYHRAAKMASDKLSEFNRKLKLSTKKINNEKILVDVKSRNSFIEKTTKRNVQANKITDLLRAAILVHLPPHVDIVKKNIEKIFTVVRHEYKTANNTAGGYYGAHHFLVNVGDDPIVAEIQLMTKRLWAYKNEAHKIYDKYKVEDNPDPDMKAFDDNTSKQLFRAGNQDKFIKKPARDKNYGY